MGTQTDWKIEEKASPTSNDYLAALAAKGVLADFEESCDLTEAGVVPETVTAEEFIAQARAACREK